MFLFLGRSTIQWLGLIAIVLTITSQFVPAGTLAATIIAFLIAVDGAAVLWVAQTSTTPTTSPRLQAGTPVGLLDASGKSTGQTGVVAPASRNGR
jgi:hypothetical protein